MKDQVVSSCINDLKGSLISLKSETRRSTIVSGLKSTSLKCITDLKQVRKNSLLNTPELLQAREVASNVARSMKSLSVAVRQKRMRIAEFHQNLESCMASLSTAEACVEQFQSLSAVTIPEGAKKVSLDQLASDYMQGKMDEGVRREARSIETTQRTSRRIAALKSKYAKKIPSKLGDAAVMVVTVPLLVKFSSPPTIKQLQKLGFDVDPLSVESARRTDVGILFNNQHLMLFSADAAEAEAKDTLKSEKAASPQLMLRKNLMTSRTRLKRQRTALIEADADASEIRTIDRQLDDIEKRLEGISDEVSAVSSIHRQRSSKKLKPEAAISDYAYGIVDILNTKSSQDWTLVTSTAIRNFSGDPDMVGVWLMPRSEYEVLSRLLRNELKLTSLTLPWKNG